MKLFTHIIPLHCTSGSQTMINDATPDIARTPHTFIKRIGSPLTLRIDCDIYAEEAVANAMMERLSNALHLKTATVAMSLSQTILLNRCINQLFFNQEKVDTSTKLFSEWRNSEFTTKMVKGHRSKGHIHHWLVFKIYMNKFALKNMKKIKITFSPTQYFSL